MINIMKKKIFIIILIIIILLLLVVSGVIFFAIHSKEDKIIEIEPESMTEEEKEEVKEVKDSLGMQGNTEIYEVQEDDDLKIVTIKSSIKYKVAFAGLIKKAKPEMNEIDNIVKQNNPRYAGIWIYEEDREKVLELISEVTESEYKIDENGYLKIVNSNSKNKNDKKLEKIIKGDKLYVLTISSRCYMVDQVTGEILNYHFENMDPYQTYEYFEDDDKMIIFITENTEKQMTSKEIIESVIELL